MKYLDPKADLTFKKVFGEHIDLVTSLLNALLPLKEGEEVTDVKYLTPEMVPDTPLGKNSIVDVRCKDNRGRQFIVEMQMVWSPEFKLRVLFNASKAYVRQLGKSKRYDLLQPVYSLNLVNTIFEPDMKDYYHYYHLVHDAHSDKVIDGLHLIFVELPKFTPQTFTMRKMQALWLRFLTEINEKTQEAPKELLENKDVSKALDVVKESAFNEAELMRYEKFWDSVSVERILMQDSERRGFQKGHDEGFEKGIAEGRAEGREEGIAKGREEGRAEGRAEGHEAGRKEERIAMAKKMKAMGLPLPSIAEISGLSAEEIGKL